MQNIEKNSENNVIKIIVLVKYDILKKSSVLHRILFSHVTDIDHIYMLTHF